MFWAQYWGWILASIMIVPTACVALFAVWMRQNSPNNPDVSAKYWDVFVKLISAFTVIFTGAMLFGKYIDQQAANLVAERAQANRDLALREAEVLQQKLSFDTERHQRKQSLLTEAKVVVARIANENPPDAESMVRFEELFFADLIGVEVDDGPVELAMVKFRNAQRDHTPAPELGRLSLALSTAVETELAASEKDLLAQHKAIAEHVAAPAAASSP